MAATGKRVLKYVNGQMLEYTIYELVDKYSKVLWKPTEKFNFDSPPTNPRTLAFSLLETMIKKGGVGLSANQVGLPYRVFVMGGGEHWFACFNPEIIEATGENMDHYEGCLSYPGLFLTIKRASHVKLRYQDYSGQVLEKEFDGFTARVIQHEMDHLDGTSYIKRVPSIKLKQAQSKVKVNRKRAKEEMKAAKYSKKESG